MIGNTIVVNQYAIALGSILFLITSFVLKDAKRHNNLLLEVMAMVMILHFQLRIITLNLVKEGDFMLGRVDLTPEKFNFVLLVVIVLYGTLWLSLRYTCPPERKHDVLLIKRNATRNVLLLLYFSLVLSVMATLGVPGIAQLVKVTQTFFFNILYMILLSLAYFLCRWDTESKNNKIAFVSFLLLYVAVYTVLGRKSTIYTTMICLFFCMLVFNKVYVKIRYIIFAILISPLMVFMFTFSQFARSWGISVETMTLTEQKEIVTTVVERMSGEDFNKVLEPVFGRIGYLDFTTELVVNRDHLKHYLTLENYFKSIVDNLLSPGFTVFDMPRMSCVVAPCYDQPGTPSITKYDLVNHYYSAGLSLFGEAYLLFSIFSVPFVWVLGRFLRNKYRKYCTNDNIPSLWMRVILLYVLFELLYSYGFDWVLIDVVSLLINYFIFKKLTIAGRIRL